MQLIIVESPTKARTISKFLGSGYAVRSSMGHVRDLPSSKMGVDVEHQFKPHYLIPAKAKKTIAELKEIHEQASDVILATDEDREGEAIAWHLAEVLDLKDSKRIVFHEITKSAIDDALKHPRAIDMNLVDAQQARRILDRLVGYELSPFLWKKVRMGLSAGRVQSVAVRLVVEREREIQNFKKEEYWTIEADFTKKNDTKKFHAKLIKVGEKKLEKLDIKSEKHGKEILASLSDAGYVVEDVVRKEVQRHPAPPFTTSTLQQEASRKLGYSAKQTMMAAQRLYETGRITYMRTDSVNLAQSAVLQAKDVIAKQFGKEYALPSPRLYATKSKGAQEAHEAIRPTNFALFPEALDKLESSQRRLYELIWKRAIACQMQPAQLDQTTVDILASTTHTFRATGQVIKFDGFIHAYTEGKDENGDDDEDTSDLPELKKSDLLTLIELLPLQHFTEPPPRFTDATLIKMLEAHGIGRPSTYAPTLTTIQDRGYVEKIEKKFQPTEIGFIVNDMLVENFPHVVDINFTSHIEEELDDIAEGKIKWVPVVREFYGPFHKNLVEKTANVEKITQESATPCPHCGKMMLIKFGRMGKFLACPDPESKITQPMPEEAAKIAELEEKTKGEKCPICGKEMAIKRSRFGYFLGCVDYPKCKGVTKILNKTGFKCPNCSIGELVERKSRGRGRVFYGCSHYPDCNFLTSKKPESDADLKQLFKEWKANPPKPKKSKSFAKPSLPEPAK